MPGGTGSTDPSLRLARGQAYTASCRLSPILDDPTPASAAAATSSPAVDPDTPVQMSSLLVAEAFVDDLLDRLACAEDRILVQFMTFEGDDAGWTVADALIDAAEEGMDTRVLIDAYTDHFVSETWYKDESVAQEVEATGRMIEAMRAAGIQVKRTRPFGRANWLLFARNHRKIVVVDETTYLGGTNISDHNFAFHDFMVRFDDPALARDAADVVDRTWQGQQVDRAYPTGLATEGHLEQAFYDLLQEATEEVIISSPYAADLHLVRVLSDLDPSVRRVFMTLEENNIAGVDAVTPYVHEKLVQSGVEVRYYPDFSHAKFLLVDGSAAIIGSANFNLDSFRVKEEIGLVLRHRRSVQRLRDTLYVERAGQLTTEHGGIGALTKLRSALATHLYHAAVLAYGRLAVPRSEVLDE